MPLNTEGFKAAVAGVISSAIENGREDDMKRVVAQMDTQAPTEVSRLAALMFLVDQEYHLPLQQAIDALRAGAEREGKSISDDTCPVRKLCRGGQCLRCQHQNPQP